MGSLGGPKHRPHKPIIARSNRAPSTRIALQALTVMRRACTSQNSARIADGAPDWVANLTWLKTRLLSGVIGVRCPGDPPYLAGPREFGSDATNVESVGSTPTSEAKYPVHSASPRDRLGKRGPRRSPPQGERPGYHRSSDAVGVLAMGRGLAANLHLMHDDSPNWERAPMFAGKRRPPS